MQYRPHSVAVTGGKCEGDTNFASVGAPIDGGELAGVQVGHEGNGATTSTVDGLEISEVNGKALVVKDEKETTVACGVIVVRT